MADVELLGKCVKQRSGNAAPYQFLNGERYAPRSIDSRTQGDGSANGVDCDERD